MVVLCLVNSMQRHGTWELVPCNMTNNIIGCKWVYNIKYKPDGQIDHYKARVVAKDFHQCPGIDYNKIFSPVIKSATIREILYSAFM